ncbi:hypothetical protein ACWDUL_24580 [Nocardia niigatensis]|uniref:hypothetical protein n=1 Tax=Nocardia niigatensis TaxID=209249 RepID=UPI0002E83F3B|nr:hypothetical protein [Nocardia niigatensis]
MNLRSLLHLETNTVPLLPAEESGTDAESMTPDKSPNDKSPKRTRRKGNGDLEERLERLLTPTEMDLVQHHRI